MKKPLPLVLVMVLSIGAWPAAAYLGPECGVSLTPCELPEGATSGTLVKYASETHFFRFEAQDSSIIRLDASADDKIEVVLLDSAGQSRGADHNLFEPEIHLAAIAEPGGEWTLQVTRSAFAGAILVNYELTLVQEAVDHVALLTAPAGLSRSLHAVFPNGSLAAVDALYSAALPPDPFSSSVALQYLHYVSPHEVSFAMTGAFERRGALLGREVHTWGVLPNDAHLELPEVLLESAVSRLYAEDDSGARVAYALAFSGGLTGVQAWVAWNGNTTPAIEFREGDQAFFHRLSDFAPGNEPSLQIGPVAVAGGMRSNATISNQTILIGVNGNSPQDAIQSTKTKVERPDGAVDSLVGQSRYYWPFHPTHQSMPGTWSVTIERDQGREGDQYRFFGASWPLSFEEDLLGA